MTCASPAVQSACAIYTAQCSSVSTATCEADLSALSDDAVIFIDPCMEGLADLPSTCATKFASCTEHADHAVAVDTACAALEANCGSIDLAGCRSALDPDGIGTVTETTYQVYIPECMTYYEGLGATCAEAFVTCT